MISTDFEGEKRDLTAGSSLCMELPHYISCLMKLTGTDGWMDGWMEWSGSSLWHLSVRVGGGGYGHVVEGARASDDPLGKSYSTLTPPRNLNSRPQSHLFSLVLRDSALNSSEEPAGFLRMGLGGFVRGCCLMMSLSWMVRAVSN